MKSNNNFLPIAEYASIAVSIIGTVIATLTQQVVYAATPLTLAILLNIMNRKQLLQQSLHLSETLTMMSNTIHSIGRRVQFLPIEPIDFADIKHKVEMLSQQVNTQQQTVAIADLAKQLEVLEARCNSFLDTDNISQLHNEFATQINQIRQQIQELPSSLNLDQVKEQLSKLDKQNQLLVNDYTKHLIPTIKDLQSHKALTQEKITVLSTQVNNLEQEVDDLSMFSQQQDDLRDIEETIAILKRRLSYLTQQFNTRSEVAAIQHLDETIASIKQRLDNLPPPPKPIILNEREQLRIEVK